MWEWLRRAKAEKEPLPPAPCGDDKEHNYWVGIGWPCPVCARNERLAREAKEQAEKEERLAELVATKLAEKLKEQQ